MSLFKDDFFWVVKIPIKIPQKWLDLPIDISERKNGILAFRRPWTKHPIATRKQAPSVYVGNKNSNLTPEDRSLILIMIFIMITKN